MALKNAIKALISPDRSKPAAAQRQPLLAGRGLTPVLIAGCPRTGTTALNQLLNQDPRILITNELGYMRFWDDPRFSSHYRSLFTEHKFYYEEIQREVYEAKNISFEEMLALHDGRELSGKQFVELLCDRLPAPVKFVGDKLPDYYLKMVPDLSERYPDLKFIITLRDGRSVIASQIRIHQEHVEMNADPHSWMKPDIRSAEFLWIEQTRMLLSALATVPPDRVHIVRYEDAVQEPQQMLQGLAGFLGLDSTIVDARQMYQPVNVDAWKRDHPTMMDQLSADFKTYLKLLGYR
ncbi:MAG: sulfotransferase family protein [Candidatus Xenobia bacterium]